VIGRRKSVWGIGVAALATALLAAGTARAADGPGMTGNLNLLLGAKVLDEDDWTPNEGQAEGGVSLDVRNASSILGFEIRLLSSESDVHNVFLVGPTSAETTEVAFGLRLTFTYEPGLRTYLAGGPVYIDARLKTPSGTTSGNGNGVWLAGGIYWILGGRVNLGADVMLSGADVDLNGTEVKGGGAHLHLLLGLHF
jgi:hypothetical protein